MRIVRNVGYVTRRKRTARWTALLGFVMLASTMVLTYRFPALILIAYALLFAGMVTFHLGMQQLGKWSRTPRNDQLIDGLLKTLGDKYSLVHYAELGKRTIEHVLVHPGGVLALTARELPGRVQLKRGRWRKLGGGLGRLFGMGGPQLGNPTADADSDTAALRDYLTEHQLEAEVDAALVFLNPRIELDVEEPDYPVTNAEGLPEFVRALPEDGSLRPAERQALLDLLAKGERLERQEPVSRRRPVKRRAA